jgi:methylmalonyl-CoA mutase cobalamin-binding subunit
MQSDMGLFALDSAYVGSRAQADLLAVQQAVAAVSISSLSKKHV